MSVKSFGLTLWLCVAASPAAQGPSLVVLNFQHQNTPTQQKYLIETMGGGVAVLDYNNDGLLDIFLVNSGRIAEGSKTFARNQPAYWNRLYRQGPAGTFTDVTAAAKLDRMPLDAYGMGVATADIDSDGWLDLYLTSYGPNVLYRNKRDGTFEDVTTPVTKASGWSASAGFFDYDNDGDQDLFVTRYLDWDMSRNILCGTPFHAYCRPDKFGPMSNLLLQNDGKGNFKDQSEATGIAAIKGKALGAAFRDYDEDGFTDIFVANDGMEQYLFRNQQGTTFQEVALEAGVAFGDDGKPFAGMGVAFDDYDNDGKPDLAVTVLALEKYPLFRNNGDGTFGYASGSTGLAALTAPSSGWGVQFADFDNDGRKDLFVAQSHVLDNVERIHSGLRYLEPMALYRQTTAGKFERNDIGTPAAYRGATFGDLNNDGAMDAVVQVLGGKPVIVYGKPQNRWLLIKAPAGTAVQAGNVHGYATTSGSYQSASDIRIHLGLGTREKVDLDVRFPNGKRKALTGVATNQIIEVTPP
ncbi:RNA-binding protein [Bryobacterales bacterium F-183]|nr:RNA-binding protein [Bryobacterales bacterium F-183]